MISFRTFRLNWRFVAILFVVAWSALFGVLGSAFFASPAFADIPTTLGYQGRLKNSSGAPLTGNFSFTFRLYATSTGGVALWTETQPSVAVDQAAFSVMLGSATPFPSSLDFNQPLFLTTEVNGDGEMNPRVPINAVAYAFTAGGVNSFTAAPATGNGGRMYYDTTLGTLNYYDGTAGLWKALGTSTATTPNLQQVTTVGNTTANAIQFAGGTSTADFTVLGQVSSTSLAANTGTIANLTVNNLTLTGTASALTNLTWTNATGTNTTSTNLFATNGTLTNGVLTNAAVSSLSFLNGTSTSWFGFATASGTTLNALSGLISTLTAPTLISSNATISGGSINGTPIGGAAPSTGIFSNTTSTNATTTNLFASNATIANLSVTNPLTVSGIVWTNATGTNTTSTNLFAATASTSQLFANSGTVGTLTMGSGTSTSWFGFANASGTTLNAAAIAVDGSSVCLANGTNCPSGTSPNFQTVTNSGNTTTNAIQFNGGTSTGNFLPSLDAELALGSAAFRWNAIFASVTATNLIATNATSLNLFVSTLSATTGTITTLSSVSGTVASLNSTNGNISNLVWTNATGTNVFVANASVGSIAATTGTVSDLIATSGTVGTLNIATLDGGSATFSGVTTTNLGATTVSTTNLFVNGTQITSNGSSGVPATTATLQTITNNGATTSNAISAFGGLTTSNLTVTGTSNLQALTFTDATGTNTTSTNLFATNGTFTNGVLTNGTITNGTATNFSFTNGTSTSWFGFTIASGTVLNALSGTINSLTAPTLISSNATVSGGSINGTVIGNVTPSTGVFIDTTSTNATTTNLFAANLNATNGTVSSLSFTNGTSTSWFGFANASGTTLNASAIAVNGSSVCLANGTNCPSGTSPNFQTVTNSGNTTTDAIQFAGGTSTGDLAEQGSLTVLGNTLLQALAYTNATGTSVTSTNVFATNGVISNGTITNGTVTNLSLTNGTSTSWFGFATASGTTLNALSGTINSLTAPTLISSNATISGGSLNGTSIGATVPSTGVFTNTTSTNATTTNFFATNATIAGLSVTSPLVLSSLTWTDATGTNTTSTNFFATNLNATNGNISTLAFFNGTSTSWFGFVNASGTTLNAAAIAVNGSSVCLANGTNCPSGTTPSFQTVTNSGNTTTNAIQFAGGTSTGDFLPSINAVLSLGSAAFRWNGNFASVTTTNLVATNGTSSNLFVSNLAATTGTISALTSASGTIASLTSTNGNVSNLVWTNATGTNVFSTNATFSGVTSTNLAATTVSTTNLFVNGQQITAGVPATTATLQTITNNGATTSNAISAFGGLTTSNLTVTGTSDFQTLTFTNATGTSVTSTNLFATNGVLTNGTVSNLSFMNGTSTSWLGFVTASGTALNAINANAQTAVFGSATSGNLFASLFGFGAATGTNVTATNVTSTNLSAMNATVAMLGATGLAFANATGSTLALSAYLSVNGVRLDAVGTSAASSGATLVGVFDEFTNSDAATVQAALHDFDLAISSVSSSASGQTLQSVTTNGNTTANGIQFAGGTSTANFAEQGSLSVSGSASLQALTFSLATGTSVTSTNLFATNGILTNGAVTNGTITNLSFVNGTSTSWFGFAVASGTSINATNGTINGLVSQNVSISGGSIDGTPIGSAVPAAGIFTNTTSTNLFATNGSVSSLAFASGTSTSWFGFATASGTTLNASAIAVNGSSVCLLNGSNCPVGALAWTDNNTSNFISPATATRDVVIGDTASATAPFYFDVGSPTSSLQVGRNGNANLFVGTSTYGGGLNVLYKTNGDDLFVQGNIGSASSVYTNAAFIASGTSYGPGLVTNAAGNLSLLNSGRNILLQSTGGGKVGAGGTTNPGSLFEVGGGSGSLANTTFGVNVNGQSLSEFRDSTDGVQGELAVGVINSISSVTFGSVTNHPLIIQVNNVDTDYFTASGRLGIGKPDPQTLLDVAGGVSSTGLFTGVNNTSNIGTPTSSWANFYASGTAYLAKIEASNATATNATTTNLFATNGNLTNGTITNGTITNLTFTNGTSTSWLGFTTASGTSINATNATLNSLVSQNVTISGGSVNGTPIGNVAPSTGVFTNTTSTNLFVSGSASTTQLFANSATVGTFTGGSGSLATLTFTNGTSTSWFGFATASGTTVNAANVTTPNATITGGSINGTPIGATNSSTGIFTNTTSTNATTTNLFATTVSTTNLFVGGKTVCLSDGTNCLSPAVKSASSTSAVTLTATEKDLLAVTTTPSTVTNQMWIVVGATYLGDTGAQTVTYRIRRGTACAGGTQIGTNTVATQDNATGLTTTYVPGSQSVAISFVDSPSSTSPVTYHLCALTSTGSPTSQAVNMTVEEVRLGADLGEVYYSQDATLAPGEVVAIAGTGADQVRRATRDTGSIGVVSTRPGQLLDEAPLSGGTPVIVALSGRVPVKVTDENGPIHAGDALTIASQAGYAMKATESGIMIGRALSDFDSVSSTSGSTGQVMMFVQNGYHIPVASASDMGQLAGAPVEATTSSAAFVLDDPAEFKSDVKVLKHLYQGEDAAGYAKILAGSQTVEVKFKNNYMYPPIVTLTPDMEIKGTYWVEKATETGFTIRIGQADPDRDTLLAWTVTAVEEPNLFVSDGTFGKFYEEDSWRGKDVPADTGAATGTEEGSQPDTPPADQAASDTTQVDPVDSAATSSL